MNGTVFMRRLEEFRGIENKAVGERVPRAFATPADSVARRAPFVEPEKV